MHFKTTRIWGEVSKNYPGKRPQTVCVCVRSVSRKSRDLDTLGSRDDGGDEVKVGVSECG